LKSGSAIFGGSMDHLVHPKITKELEEEISKSESNFSLN